MIQEENEKARGKPEHGLNGVPTEGTPNPCQPASQPDRTACLPASGEGELKEDDRPASEGLSDDDLEVIEASTPRLVIRGAHTLNLEEKDQKTAVDYLSFTCEEPLTILYQFVQIVIPEATFQVRKTGWKGYKSSVDIKLHGKQLGLIGYRADNHDRNFVSLSGEGCSAVKSWASLHYWLNCLTNPKLTRIDLAFDSYFGEVNHDTIMEAYAAKKFMLPKSPTNPCIGVLGETDGMGRNKGRTIYIGNRKSGSKFIRCYEKGLEQFGKLSDEQQALFFGMLDSITTTGMPEGGSFAKWYRCEVVYTNKDRVLTTDMIIDRDNYFVGAYPFCEELLKSGDGKKPARIPNALQTDRELMYMHASKQYGAFITTMMAMGEEPLDIIKKIANGKLSQRFLKHGIAKDMGYFDPSKLTKQPI